MKLISLRNRIRSGWLAALATAAVVALASPTDAQTVPPPPASALSSADLAKVHLTAARNALSDVTQLPAAAQLTGETRTRVQQLITSFNELIGKSDWRAPYAQVEANLSTLLGSETPTTATATAGAVGTSGAAEGLDPAIRAKLVEFKAHLDMFKTVASTAAPAAAAPPAAATPPSPTPAPPTTPTPATMPPASTAYTPAPTPPPTAAPPASPDPRPDAPSPADAGIDDGQVSGVARDLLLHVEALEVILGAQARVQKEATAAAGGAVVSSETPSGSTRTTVTGPDVTLNGQQLEQIMTHLAEMRRLLEKK